MLMKPFVGSARRALCAPHLCTPLAPPRYPPAPGVRGSQFVHCHLLAQATQLRFLQDPDCQSAGHACLWSWAQFPSPSFSTCLQRPHWAHLRVSVPWDTLRPAVFSRLGQSKGLGVPSLACTGFPHALGATPTSGSSSSTELFLHEAPVPSTHESEGSSRGAVYLPWGGWSGAMDLEMKLSCILLKVGFWHLFWSHGGYSYPDMGASLFCQKGKGTPFYFCSFT